MILAAETYWELMSDPAHWLFELTLIVIFDIIIGAIAWPFVKNWIKKHDEKKHAHKHCDEVHQEKLFD